MSTLTGLPAELARAAIPLLDLMLGCPGLDDDTERRVEWLRLRLAEVVPEHQRKVASLLDMRIDEITRRPAMAAR